MELGESATAAAEREVVEESGVAIEIVGLAGVYTDPGHVMVYPHTGEARQQFAVCSDAGSISARNAIRLSTGRAGGSGLGYVRAASDSSTPSTVSV